MLAKAILSVSAALLMSLAIAAEKPCGTWEISPERLGSLFSPQTTLKSGNVACAVVDTSQLRALSDIFTRLRDDTGQPIDALLLSGEDGANAHAFRAAGGRQVVVVTTGLLSLVGDDQDALAAILAHELGHHALGHEGYAKTSAAIDLTTLLLAAAAGALIHDTDAALATTIVGAGIATAAIRSFDRDDEREADAYAIQHMIRAGFDPAGAERLWGNPKMQGGGLFSTHPPSRERVANVRALASRYAYLAPDSSDEEVIDRADTTKLYAQGRAQVETGDPDLGVKLLIEAAEAGEVEAQFFLAQLYDTGNYGSEPSPYQALRWYREAAENGHFAAAVAAKRLEAQRSSPLAAPPSLH